MIGNYYELNGLFDIIKREKMDQPEIVEDK